MKRAVFLSVFLTLVISSFAIELPNRKLYIEGSAENASHRTFFMDNFTMEAGALGFEVVSNKDEAGYTFRFNSQSYTDEYDPSIKFIVLISLLLNDGDRELVSFGWPFADINDMYEYNQYVFFRAAVLVPGISEDDLAGLVADDDTWRNKWIYFRVSFDYPLTFYVLKPEGLIGGSGVWRGEDKNKPEAMSPIDHIILSKMGAIAGIEFHLLPFLSLEANFQVSLGNPREQYALNMAAGAELKFPLKFFRSMVIAPYGAFIYPINHDPKFKEKESDEEKSIFAEYPMFFVGGGVQVGIKMGKSGMLVVDAKYMMALTDTVMNNPYGELYPNPKEIHYDRRALHFSVGYKFGIFNRK
jgi:hypothetical protein